MPDSVHLTYLGSDNLLMWGASADLVDIGNILRGLTCIFNPSQDTVLETGSKEPLKLRSYA